LSGQIAAVARSQGTSLRMEKQQSTTDYDAIVVGAGIGGIYALYRLRQQGLSVLGLEQAAGPGGVWFHNRYPGARVDVESIDYCYYFSQELYQEWRWTERYAAQPELLNYLNHVVDRFDLRQYIRFETALKAARWQPGEARYHVETVTGQHFNCRFLLMATGNLSAARVPDFPGIADFAGEWVQTSHWPDRPIEVAGRRIAVIGTGSSGVQAIPVLAAQASQLYVFQRSPNYSVPARNGPLDQANYRQAAAILPQRREQLLATRAAITSNLGASLRFADYTAAERLDRLERQWALGGQGMNRVFADQGTDPAVNQVVAEFVRSKIREIVKDQAVAERLCPYDHPIGTRRLCVDTDYYATYNRDNVMLVDIRANPIERITQTGIQTRDGHYEVDLIVFAIGFHAFRGALDLVDIRNERDETPTQNWQRGPRTMLGLMTSGFPNFFFLTGPGSPSVLANMVIMNEEHVNFAAGLIAYMDAHGLATVAPEPAAEERWSAQVADAAAKLLRVGVENYMVHVNQDVGSRVFMPYVGGLDRYLEICREVVATNYDGFVFGRREDVPAGVAAAAASPAAA
jgi:cation diffusion facilitator CzcD-associated flavoprotein CzcO